LLLVLYFGANAYGWHILEGTFGSSVLFGVIPLADPYTTLQVLATGFVLGADVILGAAIITLFYFVVGGRASVLLMGMSHQYGDRPCQLA